MSSIRLRHTHWTLPALAVGIIGCGGEKGPTQPATLAFTAVHAFTAVDAGGGYIYRRGGRRLPPPVTETRDGLWTRPMAAPRSAA